MNVHVASPDLTIRPTRETYDGLQRICDELNKRLFGGLLPNPLITLRGRKGTFGYFVGARFTNEGGRPADEIALNPARFHDRPLIEIIATMAHEMVHLWQHHCGTPGRGRYHNREWAEKMKAIGLQPSDTGAEGGREIGEAVGHYVISGGLFETAVNKLLAKDFAILWKEIPAATPVKGEGEAEPATPSKNGKRVRYCCPVCDLKAWAKHDVQLMCGTDMAQMTPTT